MSEQQKRFAVYYAKNPTFEVNPDLTLGNLTETHIKVCEREADDPEQLYRHQQAENWSPNGEARSLIKSLGLHHTSMSVGDVIAELNETGGELRHWQVATYGFEPFRVKKTVSIEISFLEPYNNEDETVEGLVVKVDGKEIKPEDAPITMGSGREFDIWNNNVCGLSMSYGEF